MTRWDISGFIPCLSHVNANIYFSFTFVLWFHMQEVFHPFNVSYASLCMYAKIFLCQLWKNNSSFYPNFVFFLPSKTFDSTKDKCCISHNHKNSPIIYESMRSARFNIVLTIQQDIDIHIEVENISLFSKGAFYSVSTWLFHFFIIIQTFTVKKKLYSFLKFFSSAQSQN